MEQRSVVLKADTNLVHLAAGLSLSAALIHMLVIPEHLKEWWGYGLFFAISMIAQGSYGILLIATRLSGPNASIARSHLRSIYALGALGNLGLIFLYLITRTVGIPFFGPDAGITEEVTSLSLLTQAMEAALIVVLGALFLQTHLEWSRRRFRAKGSRGGWNWHQITPGRAWLSLEGLFGIHSRMGRAGLVLMTTGIGTTLFYHLALFALGAPSELKGAFVIYAVHIVTFLGMLLLLATVVFQGQPKAQDAPVQSESAPGRFSGAKGGE